MKKNLIIFLLVVGTAAGVFFVFSSKSKQEGKIVSPFQSAENTTPVKEPKAEKITIETKKSETNSSNQSPLSGSYQCTYIMEEGFKVTTHIKNGQMRTEMPLKNGDTNISLYTDNKIYQWSVKEKQGIFMSVEDAKKQPGTEVQDPDEYLNDIKNKYKPDCKNIDVADSLFTIPDNIQFQDLSEALKH